MVWILKIDHFGEFCYQSLRLARIRHCVLRLKSSLKTRCKIRLRGFWKSCSAQHDHQMMKMDDDIYFLSKIHSNPSAKNGVCANCHPSICLLSTTHPFQHDFTWVPSSSFPNCLNKQNVLFVHHFLSPTEHSFTMHHSLLCTITTMGKLTEMIIITLF